MPQTTADGASENRIEFEEASQNGLIMINKYLPEELLSEILVRVDCKTLLNCQLVCKRWNSILRDYVWRKRAEAEMGRSLHLNKEIPWYIYYVICAKKSLEKNLLKNHSGNNGEKKHWKITQNGGNHWAVECPPLGVPALPNSESVFEGKQQCFVTSYRRCSKEQTVDLVAQGLFPQLMDIVQPPVTVSEWYSCRWDCEANYEMSASLIAEDGSVMDRFEFETILDGENQNKWHRVEHEFTNYGPGLRKVIFTHRGSDRKFWAGHYGSKMAGACVKVNLPKQESAKNKKADDGLANAE